MSATTTALVIDPKAFAEVVHMAIVHPELLASGERASLLASWDTLFGLEVVETTDDPREAVNLIHDQVDAILNGEAVVTVKGA